MLCVALEVLTVRDDASNADKRGTDTSVAHAKACDSVGCSAIGCLEFGRLDDRRSSLTSLVPLGSANVMIDVDVDIQMSRVRMTAVFQYIIVYSCNTAPHHHLRPEP